MERITLKSGDALRFLKKDVNKHLVREEGSEQYDFKKRTSIQTNTIIRELEEHELQFMEEIDNKCLIIRNIMKLDSEEARRWLEPRSVIKKIKEIGQPVIKEISLNNKSVMDIHRMQASINLMDNPYMEGLANEMTQISGELMQCDIELDAKALFREKGAGNQCMHGDSKECKDTISTFLPTSGSYKLAVYQYRGVNRYGQVVLDQYVLEADVGDMIVIKSDFPHSGVASEEDGTILFAYGDNPSTDKSKIRKANSVYVLQNKKMRNKRQSIKISIKGKLVGNSVTDAETDKIITEEEEELLDLTTLMHKQQLSMHFNTEYIYFM